MPQVLPMTRVEAYLAYKAGVIQESELKPTLKTNFYTGLEHWLAFWCGLCNDYPVDENNNPKWYTEEEYYVAYLCGIASDYPVNCYRRVGAYLRYIISARWGKPEKPLTREEYYLSLMSAPYLSPNEPASIISIDDTAEAPFGDLKIYGDSFQQTYTGKNILPVVTQNAAGLTNTYNPETGEITTTGTPTAQWLAVTPVMTIDIPSGTTLTASTNRATGGADGFTTVTIRVRNADNLATDDVSIGASVQTSTKTTENTNDRVQIWLNCGTDYASKTINVTYHVMLEVGSTATLFEPYVGGIPAPNPDYPQDIQVVTGEQTVMVTGKNLLNIASLTPRTDIGVTGTPNADGSLSIAGTASSTGNATVAPMTSLNLPAGTYTFSIQEPLERQFYIYLWLEDGTTQNIVLPAGTTSNSETFTQPITHFNFRFSVVSTKSYDLTISPMLELGSTATEYQPYQSQTYPISLGSLELAKIGDRQDYLYTENGKWYVRKEIGIHTFDGSSPDTYNFNADQTETLAINMLPSGVDQTAFKYASASTISAYCQRLKYIFDITDVEHIYITGAQQTTGGYYGNIRCYINKSRLTGYSSSMTNQQKIDVFKTYLSSNPMDVAFILKTPTVTEITDATLISQLNALLEGGSYNYQTNIVVSAEDPNLPGLIQVTAAKYQ